MRIAASLLTLVGLALPASASEVVGAIEAPDGSAVAGASVLVTLAGGETRETVSDGSGSFRFDSLPVGEHRLTVLREGFGSRTVAIRVEAGGQVRISIPLALAYSETVSVTGQNLERDRFEEGASVAVVDGARLEAGTDTDLYDLVAMTPNVNAPTDRSGFSIRGIPQGGFGGGSGLLVSVRVDGAPVEGYQATSFGPFATWDLDRVEVFRGPQSTQQGRNSLAGAIVMRSADPTFRTEARARVRYGDETQLAATVNVPFADKAAFRISADVRQSDGFVHNEIMDDDAWDFRDARNLRAKFLFQPTERFEGLLTLVNNENNAGGGGIVTARFPEERVNLSDRKSEEGSEHRIATMELGYDGGAVRIESTTSLYDHDYHRNVDLDQTPVPAGVIDYATDDRWFSQEVRGLWRGARHQGVVGLYLADLDDSLRADTSGPGELAGLPPGFTLTAWFETAEATRNTALFGEFDLNLAADWTVTLGSRLDRESRDIHNQQGLTSEPTLPGLPGADQPPDDLNAEYTAFLPKVAVRREWTDALSTSVSWQRGYRAGGQSITVLSRQVNNFDPEFTDNYEFSIRARTGDGRGFLSANAFFTDWKDQQVRVRTELGLPVDTLIVNAGESSVAGAELEASWWTNRNLQFFGSAGLLRTRFDQFVSGDFDFSGNEFPGAPRWSLLGGVAWRPTEWASATVEASSQAGTFSTARNEAEFEVDGRTLVNARFGVEREGAGIWLYGRNLLDEAYLLNVFSLDVVGAGNRGYAGPPRTVGVELSYRY